MCNCVTLIPYNSFFSLLLDKKGKAVANESTSMYAHYTQRTCVYPNAFLDDGQDPKTDQSSLTARLTCNDSVTTYTKGKISKKINKLTTDVSIQIVKKNCTKHLTFEYSNCRCVKFIHRHWRLRLCMRVL